MRYVFNVPVVFLETTEETVTTPSGIKILRVLVQTSLGKTVSAYALLELAEMLKPNMLCSANLIKITSNHTVVNIFKIGYEQSKRADFSDFKIV